MRRRFDRLWRGLGARGNAPAVYAVLRSRYSGSQRAYHTLTHLRQCLREFDKVRRLCRDPLAVEAALWFHDAVYDPGRSDNEKRSAALAESALAGAAVATSVRRKVAKLILATQHHRRPRDPDARLVVDIDLSILGQAPARFWRYERQIRREYAWVPPLAFANGRIAVLGRFLQRRQIYATDTFRRRWERQARVNLPAAITRLRRDLGGNVDDRRQAACRAARNDKHTPALSGVIPALKGCPHPPAPVQTAP